MGADRHDGEVLLVAEVERNTSTRARLDVRGYSLGGHLATVFTELHRNRPHDLVRSDRDVQCTGRGTLTQSDGSLASAVSFYRAVLANPDAYVPPIESSAFARYVAAKAATGPVAGLSILRRSRYVWARAATRLVFGTLALQASFQPGRTGLTNGAEAVTTQVYGIEFPVDRSAVANSGLHGPARSVL